MTLRLKEVSKSLDTAEKKLAEAYRLIRGRDMAEEKKEMQEALEELFKKQEYFFMREFSQYRSEFIEESFTSDDALHIWGAVAIKTRNKMAEIIVKGTSKAVGKGYNRLAKAVGWGVDLSFNLSNPRAVEYLRNNAAAKVTQIDNVTRKEIARIVTQGTEEGLSYQKMAREIKNKFAEFSVRKPQLHIKNRAELVAVTETANAYGEGNRIFVQDLQDRGLVMIKSWMTVGDDRVSDGCQENEDAGWIPANDAFPSGDAHEPRFPGCRCDCLYDSQVTIGGD